MLESVIQNLPVARTALEQAVLTVGVTLVKVVVRLEEPLIVATSAAL